ncbi:pyrH, partial [Cucurbita argyrosperma subsp. argyrosperma]
MAIPMSLVPCSSFASYSSSSFPLQSRNPFKPHRHGLKMDNPTSNGSLVVSCSAREMGSNSDPLNGSMKHQISSMAPSGMTLNEASMSMPSYKWRRVLLKVSGEALAGDRLQNIDPKVTMAIAREVAAVTRLGIEVAIVVGGGNIFRGSSWAGCSGLDRSSADYIGMLATVMNAIFLQATMESIGIPTRVQTAFRMSEVAEPYIRRRAVRHLEKGRVVIFAAATNVDGVYDDDPKQNTNARLLETLTYQEVTSKDLSVMDMTAITLCQENNIPVVVFNLTKPDNISKAIKGERVGTLIGGTWNSNVT